MNYNKDIEKLRKELLEKEGAQRNLESNCVHKWDETEYDAEEYQEAVYSHLEGHGSDPTPVYNYHTAKKDRWSRTCIKCGKKEYTYTKKAVKYEPDFR